MFTRVALSIAMESYNDLQNGFGFVMRKNNLIDNEEVIRLISKFQHTAVSELITINADDAVLFYTACRITMKVMLSEEADRFIMLGEK